jgi:hypothetical protein
MEAIKVASTPINSMYGPAHDKPMLKFKDDKGIEFAVFKPELFDLIKEGTTIQAEVQIKESTNPNYPDNHNIINIYQDGKPAIKTESKGGGRPAFTKDTASIEQQVAIKEIGECLRVGLETPDWAKKNYWNWIETHTTNREQPPNAPQSTTAAPKVEKPVIAPTDKQPDAVKPVSPPINAMTHEAIKLLATDPDKLGIMKATVKDKGWGKGKTDFTLKDLTQVQAVTLLNMFSE